MKYDNETCNRFVADMEAAGYDAEHYRGRFYWTGPAVRLEHRSEFQEIARATRVALQSDDLGLGMIVYPKCSGKLIAG